MIEDLKELWHELEHEWEHAVLDIADEFWEHAAEGFAELIAGSSDEHHH